MGDIPLALQKEWSEMHLEEARKEVLKRGWLSHQPEEFREEVLRRTTLSAYKRGEFIFHLDDAPGMMFGVVEGAVIIGVSHPLVGLYQAHLGRRGDWFGAAAAVQGVKRRVAAEAPMAMQVLCLTPQAVQAMIEGRPLWYRNFSTLM